MQDWRFDDLTRTLGMATSRRGVLKGLLGGLAAALVGRSIVAPSQVAAAGCDHRDCEKRAEQFFVNCLKAARLFGGGSTPGSSIPPSARSHLLCGLAMFAQLESCKQSGCLTEEVCCNGGCADLLRDPSNCGNCGHACPSGATCYDGECQCPDNLTYCDGACVDTTFDHDNCGACGNACNGCEICTNGQCVSQCTDDAPCCNGQCVSTQCPSPTVFNPVTCQCVCPGGNTYCDGQCIDIYNDDQHCGSCDNACTNCETCNFGACTPINCSSGEICCNGACVPLCSGGSAPDPTTCGCNECQGQSDGTTCGQGTCGSVPCSVLCNVCVGGQCVPVANGTLCGVTSCSICQDGACVVQPNGTDCGGGNVCCYGQCISSC